ncbi:tetratricopeptide repeat protein, partial [Arenibacter certesii]|uniref:tetratricopeptide repeat protein n=1 Tax=Arenibacter certesii TaxID=228955 RepID=UPI001E2A6D83
YYLALQQWSKGNIEVAKELFMECGNEPDFVPFYLAKIKLYPENAATRLEALERAVDLDKDNWRVQLAWIEYYMETDQWKAAKKLTKKALSKYPEKAVLGMRYAKILLELKEYKAGLHFLENFNVLPFEGATEGRTVYHETCVRLAMQALMARDYDEAIFYAKKAKFWPKNLGVGKHYDVDERLDNYLLALAYEKKGEQEEAEKYFNRIIAHQTPDYLNESSKLYLQLMVLDRFSKEVQLQNLLEKNLGAINNNQYVEWAITRYKDADHEAVKKAILSSNEKVHAYDTKFVDEEFKLTLSIVDSLLNIK